MKRYVLSAAYKTPPLFVYEDLPKQESDLLSALQVSFKPYSGPLDIDTMGFPKDLSTAIKNWDANYQRTFCDSDPKQSGFETPELASKHREEGQKLCELIHNFFGDEISVEYRS